MSWLVPCIRELLDHAVEVGFEEAVLDDAVFLKLGFGKGLGDFGGDFAGVFEQVALVELEEGVEFSRPVGHGHGDAALGLVLGVVEIHGDEAVEGFEFLLGQIVFGDGDIRLEDFPLGRIPPIGETHAFLSAVCPAHDQLGGGVAVDGKVELVLDSGEKSLRRFSLCAVIHRGGVNVGNLLIEATLAGADFADFRKQVVKVGLVEDGTVFQPFLVQNIPTDGEVPQDADGPLAELGGAGGVDAEADGDDGVETVECGEVFLPVFGSMSEIPTHCFFIEFTVRKDVLKMLGDGAAALIKEDADELLGEPNGLVLHANFDALFPGLRGKDEELGGAVANLNFLRLAHNAAPIFLR